MDYERMSPLYSSSKKLSQSNCLAPSALQALPAPLTSFPLTVSGSIATSIQGTVPLSPSFKLGTACSENTFLKLSSSSPTSSASDTFSTYAENFDLSLLPQDFVSTTNDTTSIVYQYGCNSPTKPTTTTSNMPINTTITAPEIKIEQNWSYGSSISTLEEIKLETQSMLKATKQLIPPPPYPNIYPSPQSSPAQSEYGYQNSQYAGCYESANSARSSLHPSSPYPPLDVDNIKQELHILPPSPPESNCEAPSPHSAWPDVKSEPIDADVETMIDLNGLLDKNELNTAYNEYDNLNDCGLKQIAMPTQQQEQPHQEQKQAHDHQMFCEFLQDNNFAMDDVSGNIEQVISMALKDTKSQAVEICAKLQISQDPCDWTTSQVHSWLRSTVAQFKLPVIDDLERKFTENGAALILLSEQEFKQRVPESGSDLYAQLEVWRYHFNSNAPDSDDDEEMLPPTSVSVGPGIARSVETKRSGRSGGSHIHLWQFLKELLAEPHTHGTAIRWIDRSHGIFKIEDSVRVAKLWGGRKNRPAMNYDKLSRSIRQYYKKGIMKKTERSQRLVYQFCHPYHL